jgi:hypothetical protein
MRLNFGNNIEQQNLAGLIIYGDTRKVNKVVNGLKLPN